MKKRIITAYVMTLVCMCLLSFYASASSFMNDSSITIKDEYQYNILYKWETCWKKCKRRVENKRYI